MADHVRTGRGSSQLLDLLWTHLPEVLRRAANPRRWRGWRVLDPDGQSPAYDRLVYAWDLVSSSSALRRVVVAMHRFESVSAGQLHDHRFPLAVLPFALEHGAGPLYDMPWEWRPGGECRQSGVMAVESGSGYAIEAHRDVWHAVHSRRPHGSIVFTDVSHPPSRDDRLESVSLSERETETCCRHLASAMRILGQRSTGAGA